MSESWGHVVPLAPGEAEARRRGGEEEERRGCLRASQARGDRNGPQQRDSSKRLQHEIAARDGIQDRLMARACTLMHLRIVQGQEEPLRAGQPRLQVHAGDGLGQVQDGEELVAGGERPGRRRRVGARR
jgi:hypothetical protein